MSSGETELGPVDAVTHLKGRGKERGRERGEGEGRKGEKLRSKSKRNQEL